jgi:hypothetical protein
MSKTFQFAFPSSPSHGEFPTITAISRAAAFVGSYRVLKLESRELSQIKFFFETYNKFFEKEFRILGTDGVRAARNIVLRALEN